MEMTEMENNNNNKKKFRIPHRLVFILSLVGVGALMVLYILFVAKFFAGSETMSDDTPVNIMQDYYTTDNSQAG